MNRSLILKIFAEDDYKEKFIILLIVFGAILFYLPFLSKQFIGDDWLWLANAKKALSDPSIFWGRPMYGYFRPLNMVVICIMEFIFGPNATIFSLLSILLHAANVYLLWRVLKEYDAPKNIRLVSAFIFAFYYLNCAAIEWISVGHDLWVTGLILIYLIKLKGFYENHSWKSFLILFLIGWAAALFKESGLVAIGFYFVYFILNGINPFIKKYRLYSMLYVFSYIIFIIFYFSTRVKADKQIDIGPIIIINTWYFVTYLLFPSSKIIVEKFPVMFIKILTVIRTVITLFIPICLITVYYKGNKAIKLFIIWPLLFFLTIAVFKWNLSLFDLYTVDPISRFMYSPFAGMAVIIAFMLHWVGRSIRKSKFKTFVITAFILIFMIINYVLVFRVSSIYFRQQVLSQKVIDNIETNWETYRYADSITILTDDLAKTEQIIASGEHLPAIFFVAFNKIVTVKVVNNYDSIPYYGINSKRYVVVHWDNKLNILTIMRSRI